MHTDAAGDERAAGLAGGFPPERVPWSVAEGFALFLVFIVAHALFAQLGALAGRPRATAALQVAASNASILAVIHLFLRRRAGGAGRAAAAIGLRVGRPVRALLRAAGPLAAGVPALLAWAIVQNWLVHSFGWKVQEQDAVRWVRAYAHAGDTFRLGVLVVLAVAVVPVAEEAMFRGVLYLPLRARWGRRYAALAVSAIFALVHGYTAGLGHLFILALMFTWMMEAAGTLAVPMLAHAAHNAVMIALILA